MARVKVEDPFATLASTPPSHATSPHDNLPTSQQVLSQTVPNAARMKRISVDIDEPSHRALKTAAAERGVTIAEVIRQLVHDWTRHT